jgi:hypothetical protein
MLWFDNDTNTGLETRIQRAVEYYSTKFGQAPTLCFVNPCMLNGENATQCAGLELRASRSVLPNHFWIGVSKTSQPEPAG